MYEAHSGELALRPWHRVIRGIDAPALARTTEFFGATDVTTPDALLRQLASSPSDRMGVFGLWMQSGGRVLEARASGAVDGSSAAASEAVRRLDVSVLSATLSRMFGRTTEELAAAGNLVYADDARQAIADVESGRADSAFLLRPTPTQAVLDVAAAGDYMPAKSTLFYPKVYPKAATGLVFNPLSD
jgi:hypothetical protein